MLAALRRSMTRRIPWLRAPELRLLAILAVLGALITVFLVLASEVAEGETTGFDRAILLGFRATPADPLGPPWLEAAVVHISALGSAAPASASSRTSPAAAARAPGVSPALRTPYSSLAPCSSRGPGSNTRVPTKYPPPSPTAASAVAIHQAAAAPFRSGSGRTTRGPARVTSLTRGLRSRPAARTRPPGP